MKPKTSFAQGQRNLLKLATILDTADAEHRERGEQTYNQEDFKHPGCRTPACALGHWAAKYPRRYNAVARANRRYRELASEDFGLSYVDVSELFDSFGCNNAKNAKQAAKYIRKFVKRRAQTGDQS